MRLDEGTRQMLSDPVKRRAWVRYQLALRGRSLASVAADAGVTRQCLYHVFRQPYPRMEQVLAKALRVSPADLFPERYDARGNAHARMGRPKKSLTKTKHSTGSS